MSAYVKQVVEEHRACREALSELLVKHGADDVLHCLSLLLRDRAEATGSERYEAAAGDVARAYERRAGGELDPEKGRTR